MTAALDKEMRSSRLRAIDRGILELQPFSYVSSLNGQFVPVRTPYVFVKLFRWFVTLNVPSCCAETLIQ